MAKGKSFSDLEEGDINSLFDQYKGIIALSLLILVGAIVGAGVYKNGQEKKANAYAEALFNFQNEYMNKWMTPPPHPEADKSKPAPVKTATLAWPQVRTAYEQFVSKNGHQGALTPVLLKIAGKLAAEGEKAEALKLVADHYDNHESLPVVHYVLGTFYAGLSEDLGNVKKAIEINESFLRSKQKFLEAKTYFDLGRLYKSQGDKEKAKSNLEYLVNNFGKDELVPLAKVYLSEL